MGEVAQDLETGAPGAAGGAGEAVNTWHGDPVHRWTSETEGRPRSWFRLFFYSYSCRHAVRSRS